ncbi:hypothetical protein [Streptomyces vinaceus]|uniref:hypothetical protein n=1 Tax=Streptomyces vinaceus TaxID=1960 RepID=UPI00381269CA
MDRFARLVPRLLRVPVAFVSLFVEDRQILPGLFGLPQPRADARARSDAQRLERGARAGLDHAGLAHAAAEAMMSSYWPCAFSDGMTSPVRLDGGKPG